jgi:predicted Zn-dependent protease
MWALPAIKRRLASKTFGSEILLVVGGVFLVVGILDLRETRRVLAEGELARGKVTGRHRSGGRSRNYSLDVEFQTRAGVRVRLTEDVGTRDDIHLADIKKAAAMPASLFRADLDPPAQALTEGWERPSAPPHDLYFVPVGDVPAALMSALVAGVEQTLGIPVTVLSGVSVEPTMFDPARSQLIAEQLIAAVRTGHPTVARNPRARVIAVTAQDMYIKARSQWRFAFSLRSNENSVAVVSYARMDSAYLRITPDEELLRSRLRKMIFKNIGMMCYRLPVSRDPRSVLYGNVLGLDDLDYMSEFFEPRS